MTHVVGLGGSLGRVSRSREALRTALHGAEEAGASIDLLDLRDLDLPLFNPDEQEPTLGVQRLLDGCTAADGLIWSSPLYNGTISGSFKNALDWLHLLGGHDPPYLTDRVIGLVSAAGGAQGIQAVNTMEFAVRALRGWAVPYVVPVGRQSFRADGTLEDRGAVSQLQMLGTEVVRVAEHFTAAMPDDPAAHCADSAERVAAAG